MAFSTSLSASELTGYLGRLLTHLVPDGSDDAPSRATVDAALGRLEVLFAGIRSKYYTRDGNARFDHLNTDHLATFLYLVANTAWREDAEGAAPAKLFAVNKALHGLDLFYAVELPEVFRLDHPVGSVLGRARYGEELFVTQGCTVGSIDGRYPTLGRGVALYANATVLGDTRVGDDVVFAANSLVIDAEIPPHSVVVGQHPHHRILPSTTTVHERVFVQA